MKTKQEELWQGEFGNEYHNRNAQTDHGRLWAEILGSRMSHIKSVFEPGAGQGDNLVAIHSRSEALGYGCRVTGMDVNEGAVRAMDARGIVGIHGAFPWVLIDNRYDLVLTRGFLIHLPLEALNAALDKIYELSNRYICFCEYYSPARRAIPYRGNKAALWVDDFAGKLMARHPTVALMKYGFKYHMDAGYDLTYFLMEKSHA